MYFVFAEDGGALRVSNVTTSSITAATPLTSFVVMKRPGLVFCEMLNFLPGKWDVTSLAGEVMAADARPWKVGLVGAQRWEGGFLGGGELCREMRGWPLLAVWCDHQRQLGPYAAKGGFIVSERSGARGAGGRPYANVLPYRPIFTGLVLDTLFFAVAWLPACFGVLVAVRSIRGRFRKGEGLCPQCRYDLRGQATPGCPECGWMRSEGAKAETA